MRNLFLILLLANIVYFGWQYTHTPQIDPGVTLVDPDKPGAQIASLQRDEAGGGDEPGGQDAGDDGASPAGAGDADPAATDTAGPSGGAARPGDGATAGGSGAPPPVSAGQGDAPASSAASAAAAGNACISIGPFQDADAARLALAAAESRGVTVRLRDAQDDVFAGHWVQVTNIPTREQANVLIGKLKDGGLTDAYLLRSDPGDNAISLGLFSDINGAQRIGQQAKAAGVETVIQETYRERTVYWVDAGRARAADASALAERFGADMVVVGDAARCPDAG